MTSPTNSNKREPPLGARTVPRKPSSASYWGLLERVDSSRVRRRGMTLLEIVLAMGLLVVLSSMTYWFFNASLETRHRGTREAQKLRLVRVVLERVSREIRQTSALTTKDRVGIRGQAERIWLSTVRLPSKRVAKERRSGEDAPPVEYDLTKVEYKIARHPDILHDDGYELPLGLARVELRIPRPDSSQIKKAFRDERTIPGLGESGDGSSGQVLEDELLSDLEDASERNGLSEVAWEELYAPEIHYLRFCYFDGNQWWDDWDITGENPLPQLVMVAIGFEGFPPFGDEFGHTDNIEFCDCMNQDPQECEPLGHDQFSMVVRVPQADPLFRSRISRETQFFLEQLGAEKEESQ